MNEDRLKQIWQADKTAPVIDFAVFQKSLGAWQNKLQRKVKIDMWAQGLTAILSLSVIYFYPKMIVASLLLIALGIWYLRELRRLGSLENDGIDFMAVREALNLKIESMKTYFRRTRIAMYIFTPILLLAALYGTGVFNKSLMTPANLTIFIAKCLAAYEIAMIILTEIYFRILYTPAYRELTNLLRQLKVEE